MPNRQKYRPISFRPPEADRLRLLNHANRTGKAVNAIIAEAVHKHLDEMDREADDALADFMAHVDAENDDEKLARLDFATPQQTREALEHAKAALARDNEGIRLWMLDCGELVAKHRARADAAERKIDVMTSGLNIVPHEHPPAEMDAPAWDTPRLIAHLAQMHGLTGQPRDVQALAAIHAAEHPVQAGIQYD